MLNGNFDSECIYVIAGFVSYIITCSPAAMRINSEFLRGTVEETARQLDAQDQLPLPPVALGGASLTELIEDGKLRIEIDEKYPQAHGISSILSHVKIFGNSDWEVLINPFEDSPFFSSDFPVAIERSSDPRVLNRLVPLTPYLAIRIKPNIYLDRENLDYNFINFAYKQKRLSRSSVNQLNRSFVRCAESLVFTSKLRDWVLRFVSRNSQFRIEPKTSKLTNGNDTLLWFTQEVIEISQ